MTSAPATTPRARGCTVAQYAAEKRLPEAFLRTLGLTDLPNYNGAPAVRIPFYAEDRSELAVMFRLMPIAPAGEPRFAWKSGTHPDLYGLDRLDAAKAAGYVVLVEGPSDAQTLWYHGYPALGLPAASWKEKWADHFDGIATIIAVKEPGKAGDALHEALKRSSLRHRLKVVELGTLKDPSGLYLDDPGRFKTRWEEAMATATPWMDAEEQDRSTRREDAWTRCAQLAAATDILSKFVASIRERGVVGEEKNVRLGYLAMVSRVLAHIVSLAVKGVSSAGKSYLIERLLEYFPADAYVKLTAMSEKALLYDEDTDLRHRMLLIAEAPGVGASNASYYLRTLLSEGHLTYTTVEKTSGGLRGRSIHREGPTGLIITTTAIALHHENETRLLSIVVNDSPDQTRKILRTSALTREYSPVPDEWIALQEWIGLNENRVVIPFGEQLASLIPPLATRLRRDFKIVLGLIESHAVLHQASRARDSEGRIIAIASDYEAVHELVADALAEGLGAAVPPRVRETVDAVRRLKARLPVVSVTALAKELNVDASTASRRVAEAERRGHLVRSTNGRAKELDLAAPVATDVAVLPHPSLLFSSISHPQAADLSGVLAGATAP